MIWYKDNELIIEFDKMPSVTMSYPMPCCVIPDGQSQVSESRNVYKYSRQAKRMTADFCTDKIKYSPDSEQKELAGAKLRRRYSVSVEEIQDGLNAKELQDIVKKRNREIDKKPFFNKSELEVKIKYRDNEYFFIVPQGYTWDGATIPRFFFAIYRCKYKS